MTTVEKGTIMMHFTVMIKGFPFGQSSCLPNTSLNYFKKLLDLVQNVCYHIEYMLIMHMETILLVNP